MNQETPLLTQAYNYAPHLGEFSAKFAAINKMILRDLNDYTSRYGKSFFNKYTKDDIARYLRSPHLNAGRLRDAIRYVYGASPHFRRLISYFVGLNDFAYIVSPYRIDPAKANPRTTGVNYRKTLRILSSMNIPSQFKKILRVCLREDVFYGTLHVSEDSIMVRQLPSDYCAISVIENNVPNVTFDFMYFDIYPKLLKNYPDEFSVKYEKYRKDMAHYRYQELDAPTSFAIKCNNDILAYPLPPFAGILRELYDLEDYKDLKLTKTALENYAMLVMTLPMDDDGNWQLPYGQATEFWANLDAVTPEEVGTILSPMEVNKISFEKSNTGDTDTIADAEENLFTAAGVSSLLFNNRKASAAALALSIKVDQAFTYEIVKSINDMLNRYIQAQPCGKYFTVSILDCSPFNRDELGAQYIKACQYGLPMISAYAASQGLSQDALDNMSFLENDVLHLPDMFHPLQSSATMTSDDNEAPTEEGGRPPVDDDELTESGENSRAHGSDWV